jgi:hypothetical protein
MKRRTGTRQQILEALATMGSPELTPSHEAMARRAAEAAERRIHEKEIAKEIALRRQLVRALCRGADAALVRSPADPAKRSELIAAGHAAAAALKQKWFGPK